MSDQWRHQLYDQFDRSVKCDRLYFKILTFAPSLHDRSNNLMVNEYVWCLWVLDIIPMGLR